MADISREIDTIGLDKLTIVSVAIKVHIGMVSGIFRDVDLVFVAATRA